MSLVSRMQLLPKEALISSHQCRDPAKSLGLSEFQILSASRWQLNRKFEK